MIFPSRMKLKNLAALSRRLSTALEAGVDLRKVWAGEVQRSRGWTARRHFRAIDQWLGQGGGLSEALQQTDDYFPPLFRDLAEVGEKTGHQPEVFAQLADHYDHQIRLRRQFLGAITWPMIQLTAAIVVVGFLIWIMGVIGEITGSPVDLLGFGLIGNEGLAAYVGFLAMVAGGFLVVFQGIRRGLVWTRPIQRLVVTLPAIGPPLRTMALARLAWTMHLTLHAGMELRKALQVSLRSTQNARYTGQSRRIDEEIAMGNSIYETFAATGVFPDDFLDVLAVGEQSGRLSESLAILASQYRDRAQAALATLTTIAGFLVWVVVAAIIISLIIRLFMFYLGAINEAMQPL